MIDTFKPAEVGDIYRRFQIYFFELLDTWWRHKMEPFTALLALCAGNSPVTGEFPSQRPVTRSFDVFFHLRLNKRLSRQSWGWWFETQPCSLWRHYNLFYHLKKRKRNDSLKHVAAGAFLEINHSVESHWKYICTDWDCGFAPYMHLAIILNNDDLHMRLPASMS